VSFSLGISALGRIADLHATNLGKRERSKTRRSSVDRRLGTYWVTGSLLLISIPLGGCASVGPSALDRDHLDYAQAITDTQKQQTLLNVVRVRYADVPSFLSINQIVASYSLQGTASAAVSPYPFPTTKSGPFGTLTGTVDYTDRPTTTFSPIAGAQLAGSYVRPLAPTELFPLVENGIPVDVMMRLTVQSIGRLNNAGRLENMRAARGAPATGSPGFFRLIADLRALQDGGALSFRFTNGREGPRAYFSISAGRDARLAALAAEARSLLGITSNEAEIVYGRTASRPNQVAIITRSFIGILSHISAQIDVPEDDIGANRTLPSIGLVGGLRPTVVVRTSPNKPQSAYAAVQYQGRWFWIADTDYDSKIAFSVIQIVMSIAQGDADGRKAPVLTIPAAG